jgi:4,5-dihydroxyphthalate decarboxylase
VHLSRSFRASAIYVRSDRGIEKPADLRGKKVGVPEYQITAAVWARGFLSDEFGVRTGEMNWYQGGMDDPGRKDKWPNNLPEGFPLQAIGPTDTLNRMLEEGALDAIVCPRTPRAYQARNGSVRRLFEDFEPVERAYYEKTKIFPIMHVLGIRRELHQKHPWLARNLYQAFCEAKRITQAELFETAALRVGLPWLVASAERSRAVLGDDIFPYGYETSLPTLAAMSRYMVEQSIAVRPVDPEELFPATTMSDPKT